MKVAGKIQASKKLHADLSVYATALVDQTIADAEQVLLP
jgi:hypothetical protein